MPRWFQCVVTLSIIAMVAAVFIMPAIDLQPTALRSVREARVIVGAFALGAATPAAWAGSLLIAFLPIEAEPELRAAAVLDLTCSLLC